ncbi:hypothetical protein D3C77_731440 [compost metagenome]
MWISGLETDEDGPASTRRGNFSARAGPLASSRTVNSRRLTTFMFSRLMFKSFHSVPR